MQKALFNLGLGDNIQALSTEIDQHIHHMRTALQCGTKKAAPGCNVSIKFLSIAFRDQSPGIVFSQLLSGFLLATEDPDVVGVNMVMPENGITASHDYDLHMHMIHYLHSQFPNVKISLHAGELAPGLTSAKMLGFHIDHAVSIAGADRIGHGVDIRYEENADHVLAIMARKEVDVEVNLTSNETILGVKGEAHPFMTYWNAQVPMTISTDDEGVLRTDLTHELVRATQTYHLTYSQIKQLIRNSITYSFLPGDSLWRRALGAIPVFVCEEDVIGSNPNTVSAACDAFLDRSPKARAQWRLESELNTFESTLS